MVKWKNGPHQSSDQVNPEHALGMTWDKDSFPRAFCHGYVSVQGRMERITAMPNTASPHMSYLPEFVIAKCFGSSSLIDRLVATL